MWLRCPVVQLCSAAAGLPQFECLLLAAEEDGSNGLNYNEFADEHPQPSASADSYVPRLRCIPLVLTTLLSVVFVLFLRCFCCVPLPVLANVYVMVCVPHPLLCLQQ